MKRKLCLLVFLLWSCCVVFAQGRQITGTVTKDKTGEPLAGVTVSIKGTTIVTTTDNNGHFTIAIPSERNNPVLVFSYVGHDSKEVAVGSGDNVNANLVEAATTSLEDVVVIGYGTAKRRDVTSAVSSINARQLRDIPLNSTAQALAGRLAGVQITGSEGSPNAEVLIRVRGGGSITQDNSPLYIIDGIQVESGINSLSPQDIESIDVLKDASATAIYGARGANGVVIITTKSGRNNKTTISYNGSFGINKLAKKLDVMKPYDFVVYQWERALFVGDTSRPYGRRFDSLTAYQNVPFVDWQEEMFGRNAKFQTHNVSLNGGNAGTTYNLSLTSNKEEGVMRNSDFDRKLVTFKFDHNFNKSLKVGFSTRYNNTVVNGAGTSNSGSSSTNRLRQSVKYRPLLVNGQDLEDYDPDYAASTNANSLALVNPLLLNEAEFRKNTSNIANIGVYVDLKITNFLSFRTTAGVDYFNLRQEAFDDTITSPAKQNANQPLAGIGNSTRVTLNNSNVFTYSNASSKGNFAEKNSLTVIAGHEIYRTKTRAENQFARFFPVGIDAEKALGNMNLGTSYIDPNRLPSSVNENRLVSFFGRANYGFDDRYLLSVSARADGSSKFAPENKWSYFPSGSLAWRISNERFFEKFGDKTGISELKLRFSYGQAGNNRINDFLYIQQFTTGTQYWLNEAMVTGFLPGTLANADLIWERIISRNVGLDVAMLNNRLNFSLDVYKNTTKDLLVNVPIPTSSGYTRQIQNVGSTENRGVEIQINATPVSKKNFTWTVNFNASFNKNKVLSLGTFQKSYLEFSGWGFSNTPADYLVRVGNSVGSMWGFVTDGYYTLDQFDYDPVTKYYTLKTGVPNNATITSTLAQPGGVRFKDIAGAPDSTGKLTAPDGKIDDYDKTIIGDFNPKVFGGLNQQFQYKNFDLSIFINYQIGGDVYNANKLEFTTGYTVNANLLSMMNDRWRVIDAQGNILQRTVTVGSAQVVQGEAPAVLAAANAHNPGLWFPSTASTSFTLHSWAIEDATFVRINNITLGYTLPANISRKAKLERARIYFTVNNLAVITNYSGYDPEVNARRNNPVTPGVDYSAYPRSRTFIAGVNLSL